MASKAWSVSRISHEMNAHTVQNVCLMNSRLVSGAVRLRRLRGSIGTSSRGTRAHSITLPCTRRASV
eukprot:scaffold303805_cov40-Tisochrysis_lutea.AAC.1